MKKVTILAATLMALGFTANAQSQVSTASSPTRVPAFVPLTPYQYNAQNAPVAGANAGTISGANAQYGNYSQDSQIQQAGDNNQANVDQLDSRTSAGGALASGSGSSATVSQLSGSHNTTNQKQTLLNESNVAGGRNVLSSSQSGSYSQVDQTQLGGNHNTAQAIQASGSSANLATQTQNNGTNKSAYIEQTGSSSGNRAVQSQTGASGSMASNGGITAVITQKGSNSHANQAQSGTGVGNDAGINQGLGSANTALQTQNGSYLNASIDQSAGSASGSVSSNYAKQDQTGVSNNASIVQRSSGNYAQQMQMDGNTGIVQNNTSAIMQSNVSSAAYTTQSGTYNTAVVTQH
ncbi:hypothetical protein MUN81_01770 [Hymenobacter sp. 5317J-9]|uniref:hypothetical protein n=1 Tax=Hymenobacter sp. 5317J-9 TaxID=2932250 RepID=UPI001FD63A1A|nr:hypothetical protein [Hymenobacter sp. 5317J-9]UOQ98233.1 hypothetical protein MUN81_01770 [Hymenobacter sp. 5317J-9]